MLTHDEIKQNIKDINFEIIHFLYGNGNEPPGLEELPKSENVAGVYINNSQYLLQCTYFHLEESVLDLHAKLDKAIGKDKSVLDVGCESGITGLLLAHEGRKVTFYDYDSVGLRFVDWYVKKHQLRCKVKKYEEQVHKHDWALALDVIEHSGDPLSFLKWMEKLGEKVVITYPINIPWQPTWKPVRVDEFVDDESVRLVVHSKHEVFMDEVQDNRRYLGYLTK